MEIETSPIFDKDIKKLDKHERKELRDIVGKIQRQPEMGKPLEHYSNVFSKRTIHRRLIWKVKKQEGKIMLLLYKNRDEVYQALRQMQF